MLSAPFIISSSRMTDILHNLIRKMTVYSLHTVIFSYVVKIRKYINKITQENRPCVPL